jgi:hypothetical protein
MESVTMESTCQNSQTATKCICVYPECQTKHE